MHFFYGDKVWEGFSEQETHGQNSEGVLGRRTENSRARCRTTGRCGRKANALKALLCQLGFCFKEHRGWGVGWRRGGYLSEKEGSEITEKGSGLSGKLLGHLKTHMQSLLGLAPRKHSVTCANQTAGSTKGGFRLGLGIPCFPKLDSPHGGGGAQQRGGIPEKASCSSLLHRKGPACEQANRPVTTCSSPALVHEAAQLTKNVNPPRTHGGSHAPGHAAPGGFSNWPLCGAQRPRSGPKGNLRSPRHTGFYFPSEGGGGTFT